MSSWVTFFVGPYVCYMVATAASFYQSLYEWKDDAHRQADRMYRVLTRVGLLMIMFGKKGQCETSI
jgi:hypothetical protein